MAQGCGEKVSGPPRGRRLDRRPAAIATRRFPEAIHPLPPGCEAGRSGGLAAAVPEPDRVLRRGQAVEKHHHWRLRSVQGLATHPETRDQTALSATSSMSCRQAQQAFGRVGDFRRGRRGSSSHGDADRWPTSPASSRPRAHASVIANAHRQMWNAPTFAQWNRVCC